MAGLLEFLNTPQGQGLLSGVASYAMNARRGTPINNLGRGLAGGLVGYQGAIDAAKQEQENAFAKQFKQMQMTEMQAKMEEAARQREAAAKKQELFKGLAPKYSTPTYEKFTPDDPFNQGDMAFNEIYGGAGHGEIFPTSNYTQTGSKLDLNALMSAMPSELAQAGYVDEAMAMMPKPKDPLKIGKDDRLGQVVDGKWQEYVGAAPDKIDYNKPFLPDGTPNTAYQEYTNKNAKAGATNIVNKIDNKTGESLAGQVGPMLKDSRTRAVGAVKMADSAERLEAALSSGKVIAGPFATKRMFINQLGSAMGITGPESVTQTRQVIRALAESSVEARKELQGQGQVTENEAKAVEKAMSGNIDEMTVDELKALVSLNKKAAKFTVEQHKYLLDEAGNRPDLKGVSKFYDVPGMDKVLKYKTDAPSSGFDDAEKERRYQEWKARQGK